MSYPKKLFRSLQVLLICLMTLGSTGCLNAMVKAVDQTLPEAPQLDLAPYWTFDQAYSLDPNNQDIDSGYFKGLGAYLSGSQIIIGTDTVTEPDLKVLKVRTYEYFLTRYRITPESVGLTADTMPVYTITDAKGFSARIYRISDDRIAMERNSVLLYFDRVSDLKATGIQVSTDGEGRPVLRGPSKANGVFIGLRSKRALEGGILGEASYRTLWIAQGEDKSLTLYEIPGLLFPRDVFYKMKVERQENMDVIQETIAIENLETGSITREEAPPAGQSRFSDVTFISNDYFSVASSLTDGKNISRMKLYSTRNVNQPDYENRIAISGLFGPEGINVMESAARTALSSADSRITADLDALSEDSYILKRYKGRWIYEGRIHSLNGSPEGDLTFPMNFRDNYRVYRYDTLEPSWTGILRSVPAARDAVSSPDNFFAVVRTDSKLLIYAQNEAGDLTGDPLAMIPLKDEEIIMHEWARGSAVQEWTKTARSQGSPLEP